MKARRVLSGTCSLPTVACALSGIGLRPMLEST